jgi:SAM-dependent methyltransferase
VAGPEALTDDSFWDERWAAERLPAEMDRKRWVFADAVLALFERYLPPNPELSILEIGGAPGRWLASLHRARGYRVAVLDRSAVGAAKTRENFELLGIDGEVLEEDMFAPTLPEARFDVVCSLGLIEHFKDPRPVVEAHLPFLKPGGLLVLGVPNLRGVNALVARRLAPAHLALHNTRVMDLDRWAEFEDALRLRVLFKGYVGGFDPTILARVERRGLLARAIGGTLYRAGAVSNLRGLRWLRRADSRWWSCYGIAVYRTET